MTNKVAIIGSRASGLGIAFFLKPRLHKYYFGNGFSYEQLKQNCSIIYGGLNKRIRIVSHIHKGTMKNLSDARDVFICVRDPDLHSVVEAYSRYFTNKNIFVVTSTMSGFLEISTALPKCNLIHVVLMNGLNYISPSTLHIVGKKKVCLINQENDGGEFNIIAKRLFVKGQYSIYNSQLKNSRFRKMIFQRYAKTILSIMCLKYKKNIFEIISVHDEQLNILLTELTRILDINDKVKERFLQNISADNDILGYYTSYYLNRFLRFKDDLEWKYFLEDLKVLLLKVDNSNAIQEFISGV